MNIDGFIEKYSLEAEFEKLSGDARITKEGLGLDDYSYKLSSGGAVLEGYMSFEVLRGCPNIYDYVEVLHYDMNMYLSEDYEELGVGTETVKGIDKLLQGTYRSLNEVFGYGFVSDLIGLDV